MVNKRRRKGSFGFAVLNLFRKTRINEPTLNKQIDKIERERQHLDRLVQKIETDAERSARSAANLAEAEDLIRELNTRLDLPLTWELKRQLVERLVEGIRVETESFVSRTEAKVFFTFRFSKPVEMKRDSSNLDLGRLSLQKRITEMSPSCSQ